MWLALILIMRISVCFRRLLWPIVIGQFSVVIYELIEYEK